MDGTIMAGARARPPGRRAQVLALAAYSLSNHAPVICAPCWATLGTACVSVGGGVARGRDPRLLLSSTRAVVPGRPRGTPQAPGHRPEGLCGQQHNWIGRGAVLADDAATAAAMCDERERHGQSGRPASLDVGRATANPGTDPIGHKPVFVPKPPDMGTNRPLFCARRQAAKRLVFPVLEPKLVIQGHRRVTICKQEVAGSIPAGSIGGSACKSASFGWRVVPRWYPVLTEGAAGGYHIGPYFAGNRRDWGLQAGGCWVERQKRSRGPAL